MRSLVLILSILIITAGGALAQRQISGTVTDSTKMTVPGASVKLTSDQGDSTVTAADANGKFAFQSIKGSKINITISSIGYQTLLKHFTLEQGSDPVDLGNIVVPLASNQLSQVNIVGAPNPVTLKEDTVEYKISAYKVRDNAPVEDAIKKMPGVDVDKDGNVTAQGKQVTKVRVNGKDFFAGDLQTATKNLPADIVESVQIIDDYGDRANLTGVKSGEPTKILNINIRQDKNYGYSLQVNGGDGSDALPNDPGVQNANRYLGTLNYFKFKGNQQISVLGSINNTNLNTFSFGSNGGGGGGGGGRGGRGNALRGGGGSSTTNADGITDAKSLGLNFRDQWGKAVSVYGSYSYNDNSTFTNGTSLQINRFTNPSTSQQSSQDDNDRLNHRLNFNIEYKPDTINYLKVTPSFSYSRTNNNGMDNVLYIQRDVVTQQYDVDSYTHTTSPNFGLNSLFNHRFGAKGRNLSFEFNFNTSKNNQYDNPIYNFTQGIPTTPINQRINTDSRTTSWGSTLAYMEPIGKVSYLELSYAFNRSLTKSEKLTDTLAYTGTTPPTSYTDADSNHYDLLSNSYNYTFTTNRIGLNYRLIESKYNLTLGLGAQPTSLRGNSINAPETVRNTFNLIPTARFVYNASRNKSLSVNYNGQSSQPSFNQLQPVLDLSNALYPVQGNPNLKPQFTNSLEANFRNFSFETGNVFFTRLSYNTINDQVVTQTTTYPRNFTQATLDANPTLKNLQNTNLTTYRNADGYYQANAFAVYSKPFAERKYTLFLNGNVSYNNNVGYSNTVDSLNRASEFEKNISKNLVFTPGVRFRVNIDDIVDAEVNSSYSINRTVSTIGNNPLFNQNTNVRTLNLGVNGKNYFWKDWTLSYDFTRFINYGYSVPVTNPNILNVYVERRFLKNNVATIRLSGLDLLNQNRGFTSSDNGNITTQSNVNRLSRYVLLTFSLRLRKFAGASPTGEGDFRRGGPGGGGPGGNGPGGGRGPGGM